MKWGLTKRTARDPFFEVDSFRKNLSDLFDDFFTLSPATLFESAWTPTVDVEDDEKAIRLKAEIPGVEEKDLTVMLEQDNRILRISGKKEEERKEDKSRYMLTERRFGSFERSIALPEGIKAEDIKATFKNGVLSVEIPKSEQSKPQTVKIDVK